MIVDSDGRRQHVVQVSHILGVAELGCSNADIIAASLAESDGEDADAEAAPTADAPEAAVAVPDESVANDSESSSSACSGSEAPQGE